MQTLSGTYCSPSVAPAGAGRSPYELLCLTCVKKIAVWVIRLVKRAAQLEFAGVQDRYIR
jgi:hypothetical protein